MFIEVQKYVRKLSIKLYFLSNPITRDGNQYAGGNARGTGLRNASLFNLPGKPAPSTTMFKELVLHDLQVQFKKEHQKDINEGIASLCERKNLIIRPADKGGGIVLLKEQDYLDEMEHLLSDRDTYTVLKRDPTNVYKRSLNIIFQRGYRKGIINKKELECLIPLASRIPIYYIPKVHKNLVHPPGRPIVSGIDSLTSRVGKFIDQFLQPLVTRTPAFLKDSMQIIK